MRLNADNKIRVLCYGDSNTWGTIGKWVEDSRQSERYPSDIRWTGVLQAELGDDYDVLEGGVGGRTTIYTQEGNPWKNGENGMLAALSNARPVDLVIIMLGTNDLQINKSITEEDLPAGISKLADMVLSGRHARNEKQPPKLLLVAPVEVRPSAPEGRTAVYDKFRCDIGHELSLKLPEVYKKVAEEKGCYFFNAQTVAQPGAADGVHLDAISHRKLGEALAEMVKNEIFGGEADPQPVVLSGADSITHMRFRKSMRSAQGMGIHGDRAYILYDTGMCSVYDVLRQDPAPLGTFPLGSYNAGTPTKDYLNHANSCMFVSRHYGDNPVPLLYVTIGTGIGADDDGYFYRCAVENITSTVDADGKEQFAAETLQTITYKPGDMTGLPYVQPCWGCPAFLVDPDEECLYVFSAQYRTKRECLPEDLRNTYIITKFRLPELSEGKMVHLTPADILDQFTVPSGVMFTQGGTIVDGKLIYTFGCPKINYPLNIMVFDLKEKKLLHEIGDMDAAFFGEEIECCAPWRGKLLCNTCDGGIYELRVSSMEEVE